MRHSSTPRSVLRRAAAFFAMAAIVITGMLMAAPAASAAIADGSASAAIDERVPSITVIYPVRVLNPYPQQLDVTMQVLSDGDPTGRWEWYIDGELVTLGELWESHHGVEKSHFGRGWFTPGLHTFRAVYYGDEHTKPSTSPTTAVYVYER